VVTMIMVCRRHRPAISMRARW